MTHNSLLILGAGVSGLAAAAEAEKNKIDYLLIEANPEIGGLTRSFFVNDYIFDYTGHLLHLKHFKHPEDIGSGFNNAEWLRINRNAKCFYKGHLIDAPFQYNINQLPSIEYLSFLESYENRQIFTKDNSPALKDYFYQHFGKKIADEFLIPYNQKQFAVNIRNLSTDSISRFFPLPQDDYVKNGVKQTESPIYNSQFWYPKQGGIQLLVNCLAKGVDPNKVMTRNPVMRIDLVKKQLFTTSEKYSYDKIISSIPLNTLIDFSNYREIDNQHNQIELSSNDTLVYQLGIKNTTPQNYKGVNWIYFPEVVYPFYRIGFYNSFSKNMTGQDKYSLYVEIGIKGINGHFNQKKDVLKSLESIGVLKRTDIDLFVTHYIKNSYVHYDLNRSKQLPDIIYKLKQLGISLVGRYGLWQYTSMEDSIIEGINAVRHLYD